MAFFGSHQIMVGQQYQINFHASAQDLQEIERYRIDRSPADSLQALQQVDQLLLQLQSKGFLQATFKTYWTNHRELEVVLVIGPQYQWVALKPGDVDPTLLQQIGYRERFFRDKPFHYREVAKLLQMLVDRSTNQGYPFASARLDSVKLQENNVRAVLWFQPGPLITFDSLDLHGEVKIKRRFLQNYLRIPPGTAYSESLVQDAVPKLNKLPYLTLQDAPLLSFQNDQAKTSLFLQHRKANQIDGIIGFLPNSKGEGKLLLTGQFNLLLQNMFGAGRSLELHWESFKPESQSLDLAFFQPLLFRSPLNVNVGFQLLKEDSTFVNTQFNLDFSYHFKAYGKLTTYTRIKRTRLSATESLESATQLGDLSDVDFTEYGLGYHWSRLDDYLYPRKGTRLEMRVTGGTKKIRQNSALNDSVYNDVDLRNPQWMWNLSLEQYWLTGKQWVIAAKLKAGGIYNERLFFNDLFRLGGLKSLRGFSENTFFASEFIYTSVEPRFYFDSQSYLFAFYDQAWQLEYDLEESQFNDRPTGLGVGLSLNTIAGNFNLAWALGSSKGQDFTIQQSKVHFGYVTTF